MKELKIINKNIDDIKEYENNAKEHPDWQIEQIANSIKEFGFNDPIAINTDNQIIEGHGRLLAAKQLGLTEIPCIVLTGLTEAQERAYIIAHNKTTMNTDFDLDRLQYELNALKVEDFDLSLTGFSDGEIDSILNSSNLLLDKYGDVEEEQKGNLIKKFIVPPFTVINSMKEPWLSIKNKWKKSINSLKGRSKELIGEIYGTSLFDGAISEVFYKWFLPNKDIETKKILDPFCGGVIRGAVAELLGYKYTGFDIRKEQIDVNIEQSKELGILPKFILDDSENVDKYIDDGTQDLIFSCPPYLDLEVYSNNENDLSNMEYENFIIKYNIIIEKHCKKLKDNRFAIFVVGDVRDKNGVLIDFVGDTIKAFKNAGLNYYNHIIYKEPLGSAVIRAGRTFNATRKISKIHQNIIIFYKGNVKDIKKYFKEFYNENEIDDFINEIEKD
ncbi:ParB N-terminal domain-containing protein [Fusobacterium animalis]|uniref:ParB N-terminal domain-containing protein n=1 Tax=Fusobacterium animalis TaxID=76859 RepID=UPI0030CDA330